MAHTSKIGITGIRISKSDQKLITEGEKLRRILVENGLGTASTEIPAPYQGRQARIIDDWDDDPRLVCLQKEL